MVQVSDDMISLQSIRMLCSQKLLYPVRLFFFAGGGAGVG